METCFHTSIHMLDLSNVVDEFSIDLNDDGSHKLPENFGIK